MPQDTSNLSAPISNGLRSIIILSTLFLLCPYRRQKSKDGVSLKWSWGIYISSLMIMTGLTIWATITLMAEINGPLFASIGLNTTLDVFSAVSCLMEVVYLALYLIAAKVLRTNTVERAFQALQRIDAMFPPTQQQQPYRVYGCWLGYLVLFCLAHTVGSQMPFSNLVKYFPLLFSYFVVFIFSFQYKMLVDMIRWRLAVLNEALHSGREIANVISGYLHLHDAVDNVNKLFNNDVAIAFLSCLYHLIMGSYLFFETLIKGNRTVYSFLYLMGMVYHFGRLIIVVEVCQQFETENRKAITYAFKNLARDCEDCKEELELFCMKLILAPMRLSFFSNITINRSILSSAFAPICTYLVILVQNSPEKVNL